MQTYKMIVGNRPYSSFASGAFLRLSQVGRICLLLLLGQLICTAPAPDFRNVGLGPYDVDIDTPFLVFFVPMPESDVLRLHYVSWL